MIGDLSRKVEKMKKINESLVIANENLRMREGRKTQTLSRCIRVIWSIHNQMEIHRMAGKEENDKEMKRKMGKNYPTVGKKGKIMRGKYR